MNKKELFEMLNPRRGQLKQTTLCLLRLDKNLVTATGINFWSHICRGIRMEFPEKQSYAEKKRVKLI